MQPRNLITFFFTAALLLGASSSMAAPPSYVPCEADEDCESGRCELLSIDGYYGDWEDEDWYTYEVLACAEDTMGAPLAPLAPPLPLECWSSDECPEGTFCEDPYPDSNWCEDEDGDCWAGYVPRYCVALEPDLPDGICHGPSDCPPAHACTITFGDPYPGPTGGGFCVPSDACLDDSECELGSFCEGAYDDAFELFASGTELGFEPYGRCTSDVCSSDMDCAGGLVCHLDSAPCGVPLGDSPAADCNPEAVLGTCGPQWLREDCAEDAVCGSGFACVHHSVCADTAGLLGTEMNEQDPSGGGIVECQSLSRCEPLVVACEEGVCADGLVCTDLGSPAQVAGDLRIHDPETGLMNGLCLPEDYEAWSKSGVGSMGDLRMKDLPPMEIHDQGLTANIVAGHQTMSGCQGGSAPSQGWLLALLALGLVASRRARGGLLKGAAIG
jgi:MYXO-CTERM domain-containing protein